MVKQRSQVGAMSWRGLVAGMVLALAAAACGGSTASAPAGSAQPSTATQPSASAGPSADASASTGLNRTKSPVELGEIKTRGPEGEVPKWYTDLDLTADELAKLRAGGYKGAFLNHTQAPFMQALIDGATKAFEDMGIEMVAVTNAEFDPAQQARDVENVMANKPDIILSLAIDPVSAGEAFKPARDAGVNLVFLSNKPQGYVAGTDYVTTVTYDIAGLGVTTAQSLCKDFNGQAKIGMIYFDAAFYITNQREKAFQDELAANCPGVQIVDRQPMADPNDAERIASAMLTRHGDIQAIFAPWDTPAEGVVAALRAASKPDVKVYTIDLGATNALDMVNGGNIAEMTSTLAFEFGYTAAVAGAYGILDKEAPSFVIVPVFPTTKDNVEEAWKLTFNKDLPADIKSALP